MSKKSHPRKESFSSGQTSTMTSIPPRESSRRTQEPQTAATKDAQASLEHSAVASRAYQLYLERGGDATDNWLEAERILKEEARGRERND